MCESLLKNRTLTSGIVEVVRADYAGLVPDTGQRQQEWIEREAEERGIQRKDVVWETRILFGP